MTSTIDPDASTFVVEGILVASRPGEVRLLLDHAVFDLDEGDVASVEDLPPERDLIDTLARPVRLHLRRGARLLAVGDAGAYDEVVWRRGRLFAMATRRDEPTKTIDPNYMVQSQAFLARYGIGSSNPAEEQ
jgi:hypothetical protein